MKLHATLAAAGALLAANLAIAGPAAYIYSPTVEEGEKEIDVKFGQSRDAGQRLEREYSVGLGYGVNSFWFTEVYAKYKKEGDEANKFDAFEWENKFQLTETGKYAVDLGVLLEIERPREHAEGWEVKVGPLLQREFGKVVLNANVLFEKHFKADAGVENEWETLYQWQARYRLSQPFEIGVQGFGEEKEANAGPAIFGKLPLGGHQAVKYNVGWLKGLNDNTANHTLRAQVELEF
jgi:hypothetical protein